MTDRLSSDEPEVSLDARTRARLEALVTRYALAHTALAQFEALLVKLASDPHAPSTVVVPSEAVDVHLADSLVGLDLAVLREARAIADLGAGAGFPGLPLAAALPAAEVILVESNARKCAFIEAAAELAAIPNAAAVAERAEGWSAGIGTRDVVTARALAPLGVIAEYAAPLLREGGHLVAWKGRRDPEEERAAARAAAQLGLELQEIRPVAPYDGAEHRHLHVLCKIAPTPPRFPRRPGMARKRPL
jgi:16S rRNA (guanine527-N7)-methyltransferase